MAVAHEPVDRAVRRRASARLASASACRCAERSCRRSRAAAPQGRADSAPRSRAACATIDCTACGLCAPDRLQRRIERSAHVVARDAREHPDQVVRLARCFRPGERRVRVSLAVRPSDDLAHGLLPPGRQPPDVPQREHRDRAARGSASRLARSRCGSAPGNAPAISSARSGSRRAASRKPLMAATCCWCSASNVTR